MKIQKQKKYFYKSFLFFISVYFLSVFLLKYFIENYTDSQKLLYIFSFILTFLIIWSYNTGYKKAEDFYNPEDSVIISKFGKILEDASKSKKYPVAMPESILPFPKDRIKKSMEKQLLLHQALTKDKEMVDTLTKGLFFLNNFIDDEDANSKNSIFFEKLKEANLYESYKK
jgi:hypothetical protein